MPQSRPSSGVAALKQSAGCPFDTTERLDGPERYVVGHHRLGEALEGESAKLFGCDASL